MELKTQLDSQNQSPKAPSRDHPNSSSMTKLDYIRVEDKKKTMSGLTILQSD